MKIFDFEQYVIAWWQNFLSSHSIKSTILADANNGDAIYEALFNNPPVVLPSELREIPSKREFFKNFLSQFKTRYSVSGCRDGEFYNEIKECSYGELFIEKMAEDAAEYDHPQQYFQDIWFGGVVSGVVPFLIYNADCEKIYNAHQHDLSMKGCDGIYVGDKFLPIATQYCWSVYEELAIDIFHKAFAKRNDLIDVQTIMCRNKRVMKYQESKKSKS